MKTVEVNKDELTRLLVALNQGADLNYPDVVRKVDKEVQWAWDNWEESLTDPHWTPQPEQESKPIRPTESFIREWVENEDFEADGFNLEALAEL